MLAQDKAEWLTSGNISPLAVASPQRPMHFNPLLPFAFVVASSWLCATVRAADHIVNPGGSIQAAIDAASDGDRVLVQPGTYYEALDLRGKQLELIGTGGPANTTVDATLLAVPVIRAKSGEPLGTRLSGFTLRGGDGEFYSVGSGGPATYGGGLFVGNGSTLRVEHCVIASNGSSGVLNTDFGGGLYVGRQGSYLEMVRCVFQGNFAWVSGGMGFVDSDGTLRLEHCSSSANTSGNQTTDPGGLAVGAGAVVDIVDSILWDLAGPEIGFLPSFPNGSTVSIRYSNVKGGFTGVGNIAANPLYENAITGDLDILAGSPCVDAGDPLGGLEPDGSAPDIGAYPLALVNAIESFCFGDGSGASCPCGNNAPAGSRIGCVNSTGNGAQISALGVARLSADTLTLVATGVSATATGLFFQGSGVAGGGAGLAFGDGLRCAGGLVIRLAIRTASSGTMSLGHANGHDPHIAFVGQVPLAGANLNYQVWYRDSMSFCTASTFNLTNGLRIRWMP